MAEHVERTSDATPTAKRRGSALPRWWPIAAPGRAVGRRAPRLPPPLSSPRPPSGRASDRRRTMAANRRQYGLIRADLEDHLATLAARRQSLERGPRRRERKDRVDLRAKLPRVHERCQLQQLLLVGLDDEVGRARHLLRDRDHAGASGNLAAASVEDEIGRPALHDRRAGMSRKLDREVANAARSARDQHPLASREPSVHEQRLPG